MGPVDILYLAWNRLEFTKATLPALLENTNWDLVDHLWVVDDGSKDGTWEYLQRTVADGPKTHLMQTRVGSPVAVMNMLFGWSHADYFAKIDSDLMVPPGWLEVCRDVMDRSPELDLLGVEAWLPLNDGTQPYTWRESSHIGGIGLMKRAAFRSFPVPNGRFGFTEWQHDHPEVVKGWLTPSMPFALLDHVPVEPWASLTKEYIRRGWSREWHQYTPEEKPIWGWIA